MDVKEIRKLIDLMIRNDLRELEIQDGDSRVALKRGPGDSPATLAIGQAAPVQLPVATPAESSNAAGTAQAGQAPEEDFESIVSPMVGTFYQASSPENPPFVQPGDTVTEEAVVCIVEAMKVMNEIKAGVSGTVERLLVKNGEAVEFGQPIFLVRPT